MKNSKNIFAILNETSSITDVWVDIWELFLDSKITKDVLKEFPVIKIFMALIDAKDKISYNLWLKKIIWFIKTSDSVSKTEKEAILRKAYENKEILLEALDRIESEHKPDILWKLFIAYTRWKINRDEFLRFSHIIERAYSWDLLDLLSLKNIQPNMFELVWKRIEWNTYPYIEWLISLGSMTWGGEQPIDSRELTHLWAKFLSCF